VRFPKAGFSFSEQKIAGDQGIIQIKTGDWKVQIMKNRWHYKMNGHGDIYPENYSSRNH
jgi:hypothetical protein